MQCDRYISLPNRDYMFIRTVFSCRRRRLLLLLAYLFLFPIFQTTDNLLDITKENPNHWKYLNVSDSFFPLRSVHFVWFVIVVCRKEAKWTGEREKENDELIFSNWIFEYAMMNRMTTFLHSSRFIKNRMPIAHCSCQVTIFMRTFEMQTLL